MSFISSSRSAHDITEESSKDISCANIQHKVLIKRQSKEFCHSELWCHMLRRCRRSL